MQEFFEIFIGFPISELEAKNCPKKTYHRHHTWQIIEASPLVSERSQNFAESLILLPPFKFHCEASGRS